MMCGCSNPQLTRLSLLAPGNMHKKGKEHESRRTEVGRGGRTILDAQVSY